MLLEAEAAIRCMPLLEAEAALYEAPTKISIAVAFGNYQSGADSLVSASIALPDCFLSLAVAFPARIIIVDIFVSPSGLRRTNR